MECGPETGLHSGTKDQVACCPRCGWERQLPRRPLFVLTGASGAGKTTVAESLAGRLEGCAVFDVDLTLHVAALGWDVWRNTWLQLAHAVGMNGQATLLCGSVTAAQVAGLPARMLVGPVHEAVLDCPDDELVRRLSARPTWRGSTKEWIAEQVRYAGVLRSEASRGFDTNRMGPEAVAAGVANWVHGALAAEVASQ
jgi:hypothetical protein